MSRGKVDTFYWDSCIYLAWLKKQSGYSEYLPCLEELIRRSKQGEILIITSTITLLEVLDYGLPEDRENEFQDLFRYEQHAAYDVDIRIATKARSYRNYYRNRGEHYPSVIDAIHLATAFLRQADVMHTFDDGKRGPTEERFSLLAHSGSVAGDAITICKPDKTGVQGSLF